MITSWIANKAFLVRSDGKVLFARDSGKSDGHEHAVGRWDIPGGRMDIGEIDMQAALRRELKEEAGLELPDDYHAEYISADLVYREDGSYVCMHYYRVPVDEGFEPILSSEHDEFVWVSVDEAKEKLNLFPSFRNAVDAYVARYVS